MNTNLKIGSPTDPELANRLDPRVSKAIEGANSKRLQQLRALLADAIANDDNDKVGELVADIFREFPVAQDQTERYEHRNCKR